MVRELGKAITFIMEIGWGSVIVMHTNDNRLTSLRKSAYINFFSGEELSLSGSLFGSFSLSSSLGLSLGSSLSLCLSSSLSSLLVSYFLGDSLVNLLLLLELLGSSFLLTLCYVLTSSSGLLVLALLPGLKLLLHSSFVECALLYATFEVLHQVNALALEDVASCVGGLCANLYPVECTLEIQIYSCRIGVRIVSTNLLSKSTITWCSCVSDNDAVESIAFTTAAL